jgi:hypothetical protein
MKKIVLSEANSGVAIEFSTELQAMKDRSGKIYFTYVGNYCFPRASGFPAVCEFSTTSKEVHLRLGQLSLGAQEQLASFLFRELKESPVGLLLSFMKDEGPIIYATLDRGGVGDAYVFFHLSIVYS